MATNFMSRLSVAASLVVLASSCTDSSGPRSIAVIRQPLSVANSDALSAAQLEALEAIAQTSANSVNAEAWIRGNSVEALFLTIPTGVAPTEGSREELETFADKFLRDHAVLWNVGGEGPVLRRVTQQIQSLSLCQYVTYELAKADLPVLNAGLRFSFVEVDGQYQLISVLGRVDGRDFPVEPQQFSRRQSIAALGGEFLESAANDDAFTEGIVDAFFMDDSAHEASHGYFGRSSSSDATSTLVAVRSNPAGLVANGWGYTRKPSRADSSVCVNDDPTLWVPSVRMDIETETPASISFAHFGGIPTVGRRLTQQALAFAELPEMKQAYGDNNPSLHLVPIREQADANANQVEFDQYVGSLRVYGAGFAVRFDSAGQNVVAVFGARLTAFRADSLDFSLSEQAAADIAWAATEYFWCNGGIGCARASPRPTHVGEKVLFSPRLLHHDGASPFDRPAWRVDSGLSEVLVDGVTGKVLFFNPRAPVDATPFTIDYSKDPSPYPRLSTNGTLTSGGMAIAEVADMNRTINDIAAYYETQYTNAAGTPFTGFTGQGANVSTFFDCAQTSQGNNLCPFTNVHYIRLDDRQGRPTSGVLNLQMPAASLVVMPGWARNAAGVRLIDPLAHEWGHGVSDAMIRWKLLACEERALDESLADILAETAFPSADGSWSIFEGAPVPIGQARNLQFPSMPVYNRPITPVGGSPAAQDTGTCDFVPTQDTVQRFQTVIADAYKMSGVPSRMAQLIADGVGPFSGLGRPETHRLYHSFIQASGLNEMAGRLVLRDIERLVLACRQDAQDRGALREFEATHTKCDLISQAAKETRLARPVRFGWFTVEGYGTIDPRSTLTVGKLNQACSLSSQLLRVLTSYGSIFTLELMTAPAPQSISILNGESVVRVIQRGFDSDPFDRLVEVELQTHYGVHRELEVDLIETFAPPAGWSQADCLNTAGSHRTVLLSGRTYFPDPYVPDPNSITVHAMPTQYFSKWDAFGSNGFVRPDGIDIRAMVGTVDGTAAGAVVVPNDGRCRLMNTTVRELQFGNHQPRLPAGVRMPLMSSLDHYSHSYSLQNPLPGPQSLFARIGWRQHVGARCAFQVAWEFEERDGEDCLAIVNGLTGANGVTSSTAIADRVCTEPECGP